MKTNKYTLNGNKSLDKEIFVLNIVYFFKSFFIMLEVNILNKLYLTTPILKL